MTSGGVHICIPMEGNTLGSMLRHNLFHNGGRFVACTVPHPADTHLKIALDADDPKMTLLHGIQDAIVDFEAMLALVP